MGRFLVISFLGTLVLWCAASIAFILRSVWRSPLLEVVSELAQVLFLILLPAATVCGLVLSVLIRHSGAKRSGLEPWVAWREPRVVVALTAYDDEMSIPSAVDDFRRQPGVIEVIVVDNNSSDSTSVAAASMGARVVRESSQGYGYACMRALREALRNPQANIVALAEGDMTFSGRDLHKMIPYLEDVDMVVGTRTTYELAARDSQMDWFMSWGNLFLATLIRLRYWDSRFLGRIRLTDVGCTFRVLRREALERIIDDLKVGGDHFSPHMILEALRNDLRIIEVPIKFNKRVGVSKGAGSGRRRAIRIGLRMLREIVLH